MVGCNATTNQNTRSKLLYHVLNDAELRGEFFHDTSTLTIKPDRTKFWLDRYDRLQELTLSYMHLTSGMPARATELESYKLCNGPSAQRSVYVLGKKFLLLPHYNKTRNLMEREKIIARFLDEDISLLLLKDLVFLRPFASLLWKRLNGNVDDSYTSEFFVLKGRKMLAEEIRSIFQIICNRFIGGPIQFSVYRQVAASFAWDLRISLDGFATEEDEGNDSLIAMQFGHSQKTAMERYGRTNLELLSMRDVLLQQFHSTSIQWQKFLGCIDNTSVASERIYHNRQMIPSDNPVLPSPEIQENDVSRPSVKRLKETDIVSFSSSKSAMQIFKRVIKNCLTPGWD